MNSKKNKKYALICKAHVASLSSQQLERCRLLYGQENESGVITTHRLILEARNFADAEAEFSRLFPDLFGAISIWKKGVTD